MAWESPSGESADKSSGSGPTAAGDASGNLAAVATGPSAEGAQSTRMPPRRRRRGLVVTTAAAVAVVAGALIAVHPWAHPPVLKPAGLTVRSDTTDASGSADIMELRWSGPATGPLPDEYEIFRGGSQVGTVLGTKTSYTEKGLAPNASYGFQVIAVRGGKQSPASATLTVQAPPLQPTGLAVKGATTSSLVISWLGPAAGPPPGQYEILRDGAKDTTVPGSITSYTDQGLAPDTAYSYEVIALTGSERSPASAALSSARTTKPPLSAAVLNWSGQVTETTTWINPSWPSFKTQPGSSAQDDWTITPNCASGPCDATITGTADAWDINTTLTRSGTTYTGTANLGSDAFYCATKSQSSSGTVTITITVKSAETESGAWTATSFSGSETLYSPAAYSCEANTVEFAVKSD
jgi:Fibronectin type III domain